MFMWYLLILAVLHGVNSQEVNCVPDPVEGLQLDEDGRLHWQDVKNCEITGYIIYMTLQNDTITNIFQVLFPYVHVTTLPACEDYRFTVIAVSHTLMSEETVLETKLPAYPNSNVTVTHMFATPQANNSVLLEWELEEKWAYCVEYFRVARWDREGIPVDLYTSYDTVVIGDLAPCIPYEFTVTPIYNNDMEGGIGVIPFVAPAQSSPFPSVESVRPGTTFLDLTLGLPSFYTNGCLISSVIIAGSYANLTIPITDSPARPSINVHVDSLQPDRMYQFHVTIINSAGASTPFPIAIQTLPAN